jgi:hypothetical protein
VKFTFSLLIFLLMTMPLFAQQVLIEELRQLYPQAADRKRSCERLLSLTEAGVRVNDPLMLGYHGAGRMMMASHLGNPIEKLNEFSAGKAALEKAIRLAPQNTELRYLRYSIQVNTPGFLRYGKHQSEDCAFLKAGVAAVHDAGLQKAIRDFLNAYPCR